MSFLSVILVFAFGSAHAFDACEVERAVESLFKKLSPECQEDIDISYENILYVSETGEDYSNMEPPIGPDDVQVEAKVKFCDIDDEYFLWLRKDSPKYDVLTYTSFSQPE